MTWHERIRAARERGDLFTPEDYRAASDWPTCACGEQDPRVPRFPCPPCPEDRELYELGCEFKDAVGADDVDKAKRLLARIEARAAEVVAGVEAEEK